MSDFAEILKNVKEKRAKRINKSIQGQTYFHNRVKAFSDNVKEEKKLGVTSREHELKVTYYEMLDKYYHKSVFRFYKTNEKSVKFWRMVDECCCKSGVTPSAYIRAQFYWFDKHFKTTPSLGSLTTENAIKRAMEYGHVTLKVVSSAVPYQAELPAVLKQTDKIIRDIMKAQKLTKEEFYLQLVLTGEFPIPKVYLDLDPIYKKLKK